jgi:hypothetical protein
MRQAGLEVAGKWELVYQGHGSAPDFGAGPGSASGKRMFDVRKVMFVLAVFGFAGLLRAGDPMLGTWVLNVAKSSYPSSVEAPPKELIQVIRRISNTQGEFSQTGTRRDGTPILVKYLVPRRGGVAKPQSPLPEGSSIVVKKAGSGDVYTTYFQDDKQIAVVHSVVSKDGKTLTQTTKAADEQGKPIEQIEVFDKK